MIYQASLVEGTLHYVLKTLLTNGEVLEKDVMPKEEKYKDKKTLFKISHGEEICGVHYFNQPKKLESSSTFQDINRACRKAKILNEELFLEVEELRKKRNKIHLAGLTNVDDFYDKKDTERTMELVKTVFEIAEKRLVKKS